MLETKKKICKWEIVNIPHSKQDKKGEKLLKRVRKIKIKYKRKMIIERSFKKIQETIIKTE